MVCSRQADKPNCIWGSSALNQWNSRDHQSNHPSTDQSSTQHRHHCTVAVHPTPSSLYWCSPPNTVITVLLPSTQHCHHYTVAVHPTPSSLYCCRPPNTVITVLFMGILLLSQQGSAAHLLKTRWCSRPLIPAGWLQMEGGTETHKETEKNWCEFTAPICRQVTVTSYPQVNRENINHTLIQTEQAGFCSESFVCFLHFNLFKTAPKHSKKLVPATVSLKHFLQCCLWNSASAFVSSCERKGQICMGQQWHQRLVDHHSIHSNACSKYLDVEEEELKLLHKLHNSIVLFDVLHSTAATLDERVCATPHRCNKQQPGCIFWNSVRDNHSVTQCSSDCNFVNIGLSYNLKQQQQKALSKTSPSPTLSHKGPSELLLKSWVTQHENEHIYLFCYFIVFTPVSATCLQVLFLILLKVWDGISIVHSNLNYFIFMCAHE